ncbi:DNA adenine methylase [Tolypothrix sp. LEGE 11397]|nr:DNA adenine methylase [Tolypothrix sp. LEGE 11397]UYD29845.1 DNA adenine methylase [Tolypothrix sp. PCC 7712]UYD37712.1 DNA adenine methylase [Tolypothrix sp. PCC 7601]BAY94069.1 D12 class N6 adenine-specific DNA methyltransferase [Microchaete diplosiphon NIES-3275]
MNKGINSPFRYAGGKFYARKLILDFIPNHNSYVEPFAGGGSIFFAKNKVSGNWLNDIDDELINCYMIIRDNPELLIERLKDEKATKERHTYYKKEYKATNNIERATRWYYLNRTSYSGIMNMVNCYWGYGEKYSMRPENWSRNILRTSEKLQGVNITCSDFEKVISEVDDGSFIFIDPPYYNADQDKFYTHSFSKEDHVRLCNLLKKNSKRIKFLLTYDNTEDIREFYSWATGIHEMEWNYTINRTDDQKKTTKKTEKEKGSRYKGKEIFIINYNIKSIEDYEQLNIDYNSILQIL